MKRPVAVLVLAWPMIGQAEVSVQGIEELWNGRLYRQAYEQLMPARDDPAADPRMVALLGQAYEEGLGTDADLSVAVQLYRRAAKGGNSLGEYRLGLLYETGRGVPVDGERAFMWYAKAATEHPDAAYRYSLAMIANPDLPRDPDGLDPLERLHFAAEHDHQGAQVLLGSFYQDGRFVETNESEAIKWLNKAADSSAEANRRLGIIYAKNGSADQRKMAIEHLTKALDAGDTIAAAYLGHYAEIAATTPEQRKAALTYYQKAAPAEVPWALEGQKRLEEHFRSIDLLGMKMYAVRKPEIRAQLDKYAVPMRAESPGFWDAYDSSNLLPGSRSLTIAYAPGAEQFVAEIAYRFDRDGMRSEKVTFASLRQRLDQKYGDHNNARNGKRNSAAWEIGKTSVLLQRLEDNSGLLLVYRFQPFARELAQAVADARSAGIKSGAVMPEAL